MQEDCVQNKVIKSKNCELLIVWKEKPKYKLLKLEFLNNKGENKDSVYEKIPKEIKNLEKIIDEFFSQKKPMHYDITLLDLEQCTKFEKKVLLELIKIPFGRVVTYKRLAELSGSPKAVRAVGSVMAKNPFPLIIPCHRVIRSDYKIGQFGGGSDLKEKLLAIETGSNTFKNKTLVNKDILV